MTDSEPIFYDPETGKPLHRVPKGATIPEGTPYGYVVGTSWRWNPDGWVVDFVQRDIPLRFTREPIKPPAPLPTEPGYYLDKNGDLWQLNASMRWKSLVSFYDLSPRDVEFFAPFAPASIVPTETWDRLCVLDPEDKWDRVDSEGRVWRYSKEYDGWEGENGIRFYTLEVLDDHFGPLRFADEVSDQ